MMNEFFSICGVPICLRSQQPLAPLERERLLFRTEEDPGHQTHTA